MSINYSTAMICNLALGELPYATIASINDNTAQAIACRLRYAQTFAELLERADWGFARTRVALTLNDDNDREGEWVFSYAVPSDMAAAIRLLPPPTGVSGAAVDLMAGQTLAYPALAHEDPGLAYDYAGLTLYANCPDAVLEYVQDAPGWSAVSALFIKALALHLAAAIAVPLTKDRAVKNALSQEAEVWTDRAIAQNANSRPQSYGGNFTSEAAMARMGDGPLLIPGGRPGVIR